MLEKGNQVIFKVAPEATKPEIKKAVEELFKVKVEAVNTIVRKGKLKTFRGIRALQSDTKKAIVTLAAGRLDRHQLRDLRVGDLRVGD